MAEQRLIDANALKEWLGCDGDNKYSSMIMHEIADRIDEQPTIDAVEVVRCKDCKYKNIPRCCPFQINGFKVEDDWYCHMGLKMDAKEK